MLAHLFDTESRSPFSELSERQVMKDIETIKRKCNLLLIHSIITLIIK